MRFALYIVLMMLLITGCRNRGDAKSKSVTEVDSTKPIIKIFGSDSTGYGYSIFVRDTEVIRQPHIPAINALHRFANKGDAERVALLVRDKMINGQFPPAVSVEEIDSLGVDY